MDHYEEYNNDNKKGDSKVWLVVAVAKFALLLLLQRRRPSLSNSHMHYILELHDCQLTLVVVFLSSVFKIVFVVLSELWSGMTRTKHTVQDTVRTATCYSIISSTDTVNSVYYEIGRFLSYQI